ncbi:MAG: hypothetical protein H7338_16750 [Candidatus Sericytochromatia bacterium]|nr:hypothetical protein [Candidatus Sericytochromatia bacterium]
MVTAGIPGPHWESRRKTAPLTRDLRTFGFDSEAIAGIPFYTGFPPIGDGGAGMRRFQDGVHHITCDTEPIRIPGAIQPHGVLLVLPEPQLTVLQISANTAEFFWLEPREPLWTAARRTLWLGPKPRRSSRSVPLSADENAVHRHDGVSVLELEPGVLRNSGPTASVGHVLDHLAAAASLPSLCTAAVDDLREIMGFDRVMLFRFDEGMRVIPRTLSWVYTIGISLANAKRVTLRSSYRASAFDIR